ncbi:unnamed protein product [Urochloa humidicola]
MSGTPDAGSDSQGFTCGALLMCLYLPGLSSKKKPEPEATAATTGPAETAPSPAPNKSTQQAPGPDAPSRAASLDKSECASLYSGSNIVFDFAVEELEGPRREDHGGGARGFHGYCPSPCFDLPVELIRAGERFGGTAVAADSDAPVTAAFVFGDGGGGGGQRGGALKKMASCLAATPGAEGDGEAHLVRFLSASGRSSVTRPPVMVMPSRAAPQGKVDDGACV